MSTNTILSIFGHGIAKRHHALLFSSVIVLFTAAGCTTATIDAPTTGGTSGGGSGLGNGGNGLGGNGGGSGCGALCVATGPVTIDTSKCGDGTLDQDKSEQCDDGNKNSGDGCNELCQLEANWKCPNPGKPCEDQRKCGNGVLTSDEACDDNNTDSGDGCSSDCKTVEPGYQCRVPGKHCTPLCGDGKITGSEKCDDGNDKSDDGCSSTCQIEPGATCPDVGKPCIQAECGNGKVEAGELCDAGKDKNGLFYGDGKGCSKTCTKEPNCRDSAGKNQACSFACGDGNKDPGEECDDGNQVDGDGCSKDCKKVEDGFKCEDKILQDTSTCTAGAGQCLQLPITYRDFQPENVSSGGHPDFYWLGTKTGSTISTWCVPNSGGPSKGNDSTARCWDIAAADLVNGKPQYNSARANNTCACQFSDWNRPNASRIAGGYTDAESPLSNGSGGFRSDVTSYTASTPGGPIWKGQVPIVKSKDTFNQWFNDDSTVNKTYTGVLELASTTASNVYQFSSQAHLMDGGFFPLDTLHASQKTLCNMWPYWHKWTTCGGDQYLFPPRVLQSDCPDQKPLTNGCWVTGLTGQLHDSYFTDEARYYFVYDGTAGISLQFYGDDDLFIFINGKLVLDLGGVHQQLPGKVTVTGDPGNASVTEGGCLDTSGNITQTGCAPTNTTPPAPVQPDDYRIRTVKLDLKTGSVYEIAIFGADRHPTESNYQLTLNGYSVKRSICVPRCGDGIVSGGEECDDGDGKNNDSAYGGCTTKCKFGPFCGDGVVTEGKEQCDQGKKNGSDLGPTGCTFGCTIPHVCGDGVLDTDKGEQCDLGSNNGKPMGPDGKPTDDPKADPICTKDCKIFKINM